MKTLAIAAAAILTLAGTPAAAAYIYTPTSGYQMAEGNVNNAVFHPTEDRHVQWSFKSTIFGDDPLYLNGVSFRFDSGYGGTSGTFLFGSNFRVSLATLDEPLSTTFANNLDGGVTVMSGAQSIPYLVGAPPGETKPFGVHLTFATPYLYRPGQGDLIFDMYAPAQSDPRQAIFGTFDFVMNHPLERRVFNTNPAATTGQIQGFGPVARFDVTAAPAPEPASWALMILGFGGAGALLRRQRSASRAALAVIR